MAEAVRAARRQADVVVCFMHWGVELHAEPDSRQAQLASACLAAGAQVVLGAHPHVLGSIVRPNSRTLVAWTLGNFVFPSTGVTARSGILQVRLDARGVRGYRVLPREIDGFRPRLLSAAGHPWPVYPQVAHSAVEMLIIQNPQNADFSVHGTLERVPKSCRLTSAPSAQRE